MAATGRTYLPDDAAGYVLDSPSLAIAGGLLGLRDGADAKPREWMDPLQFADEFTAAADLLTGPA